MKALYILLYTFALARAQNSYTSSAIPEHLQHCFKQLVNDDPVSNPPLNIRLLVELLRKLEFDKGQFNIRVLSNSILHTAKFDGIKRGVGGNVDLLPYRASNEQFYKYRVIVDHLTPGDSELFPWDAVTKQQFCALHFIISNTIDSWVRGDEAKTCYSEDPVYEKESGSNTVSSSCPVERGVLLSKWGSSSGGHLIAGIAAALQADTSELADLVQAYNSEEFARLSTSGTVNNILVSTFVGDLAEVLINQGIENPNIGYVGYWNDTILPKVYYQNGNYWDMTEAELLGGIDSYILSNRVKSWLRKYPYIHLSQLIDMYYSHRGVTFDTVYRACDRFKHLKDLLDDMDLAQEIAVTAKLLQSKGNYDFPLRDEFIDKYSVGVAQTFVDYTESLAYKFDTCEKARDVSSQLEVIAIFDDSWTRHGLEKFISLLTDVLDVSYYGSKIGIINGQGNWIANITHDVLQIYTELALSKYEPATLSLNDGLHAVIQHYQLTSTVCTPNEKPRGRVVLVMAQSTHLSDTDRKESLSSVESIASSNPETKIIYVTNGDNSFESLAEGRNAKILLADELAATNSNAMEELGRQLLKELIDHPSNIVNFYCKYDSHFEDYVTPGVYKEYEVREEYTKRKSIKVQFKGNGYGDLSVCCYNAKVTTDSAYKACQDVTVDSEVTFIIKDCCSNEDACTARFSVSVRNSTFKCSEHECRYPDQLRIDLYSSWNVAVRLTANYSYILPLIVYYLLS